MEAKKDFYSRINEVYPFMRVEGKSVGDKEEHEVIVRITSRCNQGCDFCSAETGNFNPDITVLRKSIQDAVNMFSNPSVTLTGGEPALRKDLKEIIRYALRLKRIRFVQVQTNAVVIGLKPERFIFPKSQKLSFFVSLHGISPNVYDACTQSKGQLPFAIKGIQFLLNHGHRLTINCVVNKVNVHVLKEYVRSIPEIFAFPNKPRLHFSILMCPEYRKDAANYLIPYSLLMPELEQAFHLANEIGLEVDSLLSSTHASIPPCILSGELRVREGFPEIQDNEAGYEDFSKVWVKSQGCRQCRETNYCLGLPGEYAKRFGFNELKPILNGEVYKNATK